MQEKVMDPELEKKVKEKVDSYVKAATDQMQIAKAETLKTKEEMVKSIQEKPIEWVAGAFVAGLLIGKLLSK
ncbi:MAG: hypothetical protein JW778_05020 [Candidatus Altiarchaeota archaeon]|nr:hypothetical protein [Candidatus Altiarchaeota archaeon]